MLRSEGIADFTYVFLIAPQSYRTTNTEAIKYPNYVSYEEMYDFFSNTNIFKAELIASAMKKQKAGYAPIENSRVTSFWKEYYRFKRENFDYLILTEIGGARGSRASWVTFKTYNKKIEIWHKADRGFVDMQISGLGEFYEYVRTLLSNLLDDDNMDVVQTGKSVAVRLRVDKIDFNKEFSIYEKKEIPQALNAVSRLFELSKCINYDRLCRDVEIAKR